jgi:hypothetical protein
MAGFRGGHYRARLNKNDEFIQFSSEYFFESVLDSTNGTRTLEARYDEPVADHGTGKVIRVVLLQ